jgi:DNA-directed RNA polymerase subunit RPC12/RpoP
MYLKEEIETTTYTRTSKLGKEHTHSRIKRIIVFRCDNCGEIFKRDRATMSPKRLSNNYFHCCSNCNSKRFAQKKSTDRKNIWNKPASSLDDISKL